MFSGTLSTVNLQEIPGIAVIRQIDWNLAEKSWLNDLLHPTGLFLNQHIKLNQEVFIFFIFFFFFLFFLFLFFFVVGWGVGWSGHTYEVVVSAFEVGVCIV